MERTIYKKKKNVSPAVLIWTGVFLGLLAFMPMALRARTTTLTPLPNSADPFAQSRAEAAAAGGNSTAGTLTADRTNFENPDIAGAPKATVKKTTGGVSLGQGAPAAGTAVATHAAAATSVIGTPLTLIIPKLGITSHIQQVGLTAAGNMDTAKSAVDVAWYKLGPKPGEQGSAVIAGHVNTYYNPHGVFEHLGDLAPGDRLSVVDENGKTFNFVVTAKKLIDYNAPTDEVFAPTSGRHLNLVTCAGTWQADKHVYDKRMVIFTELAQ